VPQPQWKDLAQQISFALGYSGTVSDVTASAPEAMTEPFHFSYSYHRKNYPDWSNRQFTVPGLPFLMPTVKDDAANPIWLGSPQEMVADSTVEIPNGYKLQLPANVDLNYDFAEYHASYSQDHRVLTSKRRLLSKLREIPVAELEDYRTFLKNLQNDVNQYVQTSSLTIPSPPNLPVPSAIRSFLGDIASLPESHNAEANQLDQDARAAMETQDVARAEYSLKTALAEKDPKFTRGWLHLGLLYAGLADKDNAIAAFNRAIDSPVAAHLSSDPCLCFDELSAPRRSDSCMAGSFEAGSRRSGRGSKSRRPPADATALHRSYFLSRKSHEKRRLAHQPVSSGARLLAQWRHRQGRGDDG
jgi:tetratricopeptide (TPR) repeat protein